MNGQTGANSAAITKTGEPTTATMAKRKTQKNKPAPAKVADVEKDMTDLPVHKHTNIAGQDDPEPPQPAVANGAAGEPLPPRPAAEAPQAPQPPQDAQQEAPQAPPPPQQPPQPQAINQTNLAIMQVVEMAKNDDLVGLGLVGLGKQGQIIQMVSSDRTPITEAVLYAYLIKQANKVQETMKTREEDEIRLAELDRARKQRAQQRQAEMDRARAAVQGAGQAQ